MTVIETTLATDFEPQQKLPLYLRLLTKIVPIANPDLEDRYHRVRKWWVEVNELGIPQRELGFNEEGQAVVAGPLGRNTGFWTDSTMTFEAGEYAQVPRQEFQIAWSSFVQTVKDIADPDDLNCD